MILSIVFLVSCFCSCEAETDADTAFGFTNFKIKLKSDHGVIHRNVKPKPQQVDFQPVREIPRRKKFHQDLEELLEEENEISNEILLPEPGGPVRFDPVKRVKVPMVFILNERIENPKFVSRKPKRQRLSNAAKPLPIFNEIPVVEKPLKKQLKHAKPIVKKFKQKFENFKVTGNHANILNTNFRFAYLKRIKQKMNAEIVVSDVKSPDKSFRRQRKVRRVRKKI